MIGRRLWHFIKYSFRLFKVQLQMLYGIWKISKLPKPIVSIFGGARLKKGDPYFTQASELASRLTRNDISVITGGGPGVMEAVNCGAISTNSGKGRSIGIGVSELGEGRNPCVQEYVELDYFYARKWLMTHFADAFVVFPGGFGTLDEMAEVLTLIQTKKVRRRPVVLIGKEFWEPFLEWTDKEALEHGLISEDDLKLFIVTDDLEKAFCTIRDECEIPSVKKK